MVNARLDDLACGVIFHVLGPVLESVVKLGIA